VENELNYVQESMDPSGGIPTDASGVLARIKEKGVLRVATDGDWPPQEFYDPERGEYAGADMELARLIASRMGVRLELVVMPFEEVLPSLTEGTSDLAISALAFVPSRALQYTMSKGYFMSDAPITVIVIREEDKDRITSLDDLQGRTIIAQRGSLQESIIAGKIKQYKEFRRVALEGDEGLYHLYEMLTEGSADALAMDIENAEDYLRDHPDCGLMIVPGDENRFVLEKSYQGDRVAARKGEYQLVCFVNGVIDELLAADQYRAWFDSYAEYADRLGM
jgi:polar amino acid transport system substrate-binding protein